MEFGLELMTVIGADQLYTKREFLNHVIDEVDGTDLIVFLIDLKRPDACGIINGRILKALDFGAVLSLEDQELDVNLNVMARNLLVVALGVDPAKARSSGQPAHAIALQNAIDACTGYFDVMIACQIPHDPIGPQMIGLSEMQDFFNNLKRRLFGM